MARLKAQRPRPRRLPQLLRLALVWTVPSLLVLAPVALVALGRVPAAQPVLDRIWSRTLAASASLGLAVNDVQVEGRETTDAATIMAALAADRGTPILAVSPSRARDQLLTLPWVRSAVIERRLPDTLYVHLVERKPLAIWQHGGKQELIDRDGAVIPVKDLDRFAKLPIVVGDDAAPQAAALIDMLATEPDLASRVGAAIRVGGRRWNLRVDGSIDVLLPDSNTAAAWAHLAQLERTDGLLKRDVQIVDMRLPDRLVLRVNTPSSTKEISPAKETTPAKKPHPSGKST
jgi:cell division protein FtsQ